MAARLLGRWCQEGQRHLAQMVVELGIFSHRERIGKAVAVILAPELRRDSGSENVLEWGHRQVFQASSCTGPLAGSARGAGTCRVPQKLLCAGSRICRHLDCWWGGQAGASGRRAQQHAG